MGLCGNIKTSKDNGLGNIQKFFIEECIEEIVFNIIVMEMTLMNVIFLIYLMYLIE